MFKVDFEKAHDNVDWGFLDYVLLKKKVRRKRENGFRAVF